MLQYCVPREVVLSVDFDFVCVVVLLIFISVNFFNSFLPYLRLTVKIFQFLQLSTKFLAVLRLSVNPAHWDPLWLVQALNLTRRWAFALRLPKFTWYIQIPTKVGLGSITSFYFSVGRIRLCRLPNLIEPYRSIKFSIWFSSINKTFDLVRVATSGVIINSCEGLFP